MNVASWVQAERLWLRAKLEAVEGGGLDCGNARFAIVNRYVAAFAVNFTDWLGRTYPELLTEVAKGAVRDNLRCESSEDHVGMLLNFLEACGGNGAPGHQMVREASFPLREIRSLFKDPEMAGVAGLTLVTLLENLSLEFIPVLERCAKHLGATDLTYTQKHGQADIEHAKAFISALQTEIDAFGHGYRDGSVYGEG